MAINKPIDEITQHDLQSLVGERESESRTLDYKEMQRVDNQSLKDEFRKDVTSFANSVGGDIIVGIRDLNGEPVELCGFELGQQTAEQYKLGLLEVLQSHIKPRVLGISIRVLPLDNGRWATILRVPNSFGKPHQVEIGSKDFQFWLRHDGGKQRMDIDDLRNIISLSETLSDK